MRVSDHALVEPMDTGETTLELPEPVSVQEQFSKRSIFVVCNVDTVKHSSAYWLTNLVADDSTIEETDDRYCALCIEIIIR